MEASNDSNMQIFKAIQGIITDPDFNIATQAFFATHSKAFDDNVEENKHEYKQIYEEYLSITERVIEAKIRDVHGFDEESFKRFLESFAEKKAEYEVESPDTVDMLYGMIEFDEFKKKMIAAKQGMLDSEGTEKDDEAFKDYQKLQADNEWENFQKFVGESLTDRQLGWQQKVTMNEFKNG
jgi:hypothetical protein